MLSYPFLLVQGHTAVSHLPDIRQAVAPLPSAVLGVLIVSMTFHGARRTYTRSEKDCGTNLNADINGDGVRLSIWAQIGTLIVISTTGNYSHFNLKMIEYQVLPSGSKSRIRDTNSNFVSLFICTQ
jgi:hypothetical protein